MVISHLEPRIVWGYFEEICKIPRLSKNEENIRKFLKNFANKNRLKVKEDKIGNILITKEADPGYENRKCIVLQSHMDMVGEKDAETVHNWLKDPIVPIIEDGWVTAKITTLGADDGIGMAAQMAAMTDPGIKSGKIESLFTVDEESGMTGAINLEPGFFDSKILLNLDSEDEGELFIGCAGGIDTVSTFNYTSEKAAGDESSYKISVTGLHGGHSGDEIHNGYANSVKVITKVINELDRRFNINLSNIDAGNLRNAIPREAFAIVYTKVSISELNAGINNLEKELREEFISTEPNLSISIESFDGSGTVIERSVQKNLLKALDLCPHGVIAWSASMKDLVETSTNLASVKMDNKIIKVVTSQRSSNERSKHDLASRISRIFSDVNAVVSHSDGYPGWDPDTDSEILKITAESYRSMFKTEPLIRAIHAGLECGLILEKYPDLDMISFGPTIKGAHTPEEKIDINTTQKFWNLLLSVIQNIPDA